MIIDKIFIGKAVENGAEDGGPGSGNWGHRGRPGLVGGSGKGGGSHYRGGRSDIMYTSTKTDWLNGLSGERQREVTNWLKRRGNGDIKKGQEEMLKSDDPSEIHELLKAMTEARQWDKYKDRWMQNLNEPSRALLQQYLDFYEGETIAEKLDDLYKLRNIKGMQTVAKLMNGAMNREGPGVEPEHKAPESKLTSFIFVESGDDYPTQSMKRDVENKLAWAIGLKSASSFMTPDDINRALIEFEKKGLETAESTLSSSSFLRALGQAADYRNRLLQTPERKIVSGVDDLIKENLSMLDMDMSLGPIGDGNITQAENRFFEKASNEQIQKYLSNKYQILGGSGPLKAGDLSKSLPLGLIQKIKTNGVPKMAVTKFPDGKIPTHDEIVARVGGLDKTDGSCASLTWVYLGNSVGYDVLDFRGGMSEKTFSKKQTVEMMRNLPGVESFDTTTASDFTGWHKVQKHIKPGKEYVLSCARHQALVRINPDNPSEYQFLELQRELSDNGWKTLDDEVLKSRFGARKSYRDYNDLYFANYVPVTRLFDADSVRNCPLLGDVLQYMNTNANDQKKGVGGSAK